MSLLPIKDDYKGLFISGLCALGCIVVKKCSNWNAIPFATYGCLDLSASMLDKRYNLSNKLWTFNVTNPPIEMIAKGLLFPVESKDSTYAISGKEISKVSACALAIILSSYFIARIAKLSPSKSFKASLTRVGFNAALTYLVTSNIFSFQSTSTSTFSETISWRKIVDKESKLISFSRTYPNYSIKIQAADLEESHRMMEEDEVHTISPTYQFKITWQSNPRSNSQWTIAEFSNNHFIRKTDLDGSKSLDNFVSMPFEKGAHFKIKIIEHSSNSSRGTLQEKNLQLI